MEPNLDSTKEPLKKFYGRLIEQMPKLIMEDRVPMNVAQLMQRRLENSTFNGDIKSPYYLLSKQFDTGDAIVYHPNGDIKIVLDAQPLREMNLRSKLKYGALILTEDAYKNLPGEEFYPRDVNRWFSDKEEVKAHPIWRTLARDQTLLNDYTNYVFTESRERFNHNTAMGIFLSEAHEDVPELRAWYICMLEITSGAVGWDRLDDFGTFLGITKTTL
jgi:hypothetical protein